MKHPLKNLTHRTNCIGGLRGHLFENIGQNVPRNVFWTASIVVAEIDYLDEPNLIEVTLDWLELADHNAEALITSRNSDAECSFYLFEHHPAESWKIRLGKTRPNGKRHFVLDGVFDFVGLDDDPIENLNIGCEGYLTMGEISVMPANFDPAPTSPVEAKNCSGLLFLG